MIRVTISVEGDTEEAFIKDILYDSFYAKGINLTAINMRGNISIDRIIPELRRHYHNSEFLTTFYDFYGFKRNNKYFNCDDLVNKIVERLAQELKRGNHTLDMRKFLPYIQMHEFEGLLFSDVEAFRLLNDIQDEHIEKLKVTRKAFNTPEDINNSKETSPSHRLTDLKIGYNKVEFGPILAMAIGLPTIRKECPRFNKWLTWLENLAAKTSA
jgi:hypothetical protein